jgi:transposase-like protein
MPKPKFDSFSGKGQAKVHTLDEEELAQLLAKSTWTQQDAEQVFQAQAESGQCIAAFAAQHGLTSGRLYNWKRRWKHQPVAADPASPRDEEVEDQVSVAAAGLDLEAPGERRVYEHLERATGGERPTWRLLDLGRKGPALLCVVRWAQRAQDPKPYSLVEMELSAPALRWHDFATVQEARKALDHRRSSAGAMERKGDIPALVKVQVRAPASVVQAERPLPPTAGAKTGCITVCLPSKVRIQIRAGVPDALLRTVLGTLGATSC